MIYYPSYLTRVEALDCVLHGRLEPLVAHAPARRHGEVAVAVAVSAHAVLVVQATVQA